MQLGFVIDQSRCIGCHACTVACKSENDVPLGSFRTWVKYVEEGAFPRVRRSFTVLRCNQCSQAPCVEICPVHALAKRPDGIVDVDPRLCIGCKGCMQACPYDALYINEGTGTAQKCHFCAHRTERGLAPACAVVCPTEAIVPGDFDDPKSRVSRMKAEFALKARKAEARTGPNVLYRAANPAGLDPLQTNAAGGFLWANQAPGIQLDAQTFEALEQKARARTTYDVTHPPPWGEKVVGYLFTKSLAAGIFLAGAALTPPLAPPGQIAAWAAPAIPLVSLLFLALTLGLLVGDLRRPARFLFVLTKANWGSWLCRGALILFLYSAFLALWTGLSFLSRIPEGPGGLVLLVCGALAALASAAYTAWLFGQAKGRVLWMKEGLALHLAIQALLGGFGTLLVVSPWLNLGSHAAETLRWGLAAALTFHAALALLEPRLSPAGREEEYRRTARLVHSGPFAFNHWAMGTGAGVIVPLLLLLTLPELEAVAGGLALAGLYVEERVFVRAGQALPIS